MQFDFTFNLPKKIVSSTGLYPGMLNDDLSFTFTAKDVHTTDPNEIDKMLAELDATVVRYKKDLRKHIENEKPKN
jgi:hypothetical protein